MDMAAAAVVVALIQYFVCGDRGSLVTFSELVFPSLHSSSKFRSHASEREGLSKLCCGLIWLICTCPPFEIACPAGVLVFLSKMQPEIF